MPRLRKSLVDPPEKAVAALLRRRLLERAHLRALRIDLADHVLDRAALARGVQALQDKQDAAIASGAPVRKQLLLEIGQPRRQLGLQLRPCSLAAAVRGRRRAGVDGADVDAASRNPKQLRHGSRPGHGESPLSDSNRRPRVYKTRALTN